MTVVVQKATARLKSILFVIEEHNIYMIDADVIYISTFNAFDIMYT